ncbi:16S rRNA (cytidine(1402)-2'-O)-methyltransferase, partial [Candidatus Aerophobetes bacterium Ae_b3a]
EDTRHTRKLLSHYDIHTSVTSFYQQNQFKKAPYLINCLENGQDIALVSKAGMPGISDPGYYLIREAVKKEIRIVPIPGPTALIIALVASGISMESFVFEGFLGRSKAERKKKLNQLKKEKRTIILYESPHRIKKILPEIREILGERNVVVARELTKKFEEIIRGSVSEVEAVFLKKEPRGEFTLVIEGKH